MVRKIKHGLSHTRIYQTYNDIKQRCYNKNHKQFYYWGGRGITMCQEWLDKKNGFINFYNWAMSNGYNDKLEIDRIDVNGNYEPNNCKWATEKEQQWNRRDTILLTYKGITKPEVEWRDILGFKRGVIDTRLKHNWSIEKIFETPVIFYKQRKK